MMADDTEEPIPIGRKKDGTFAKGSVPNPKGRPVGARNKHLIAAEILLDGEAEKLTRKAVELALAGDSACLRLCIDRILPPRKDRPVCLDLPPMKTLEDIAAGMNIVVEAVANSEITPSEGAAVTSLLQGYSQAIEVTELAKRIEVLESRSGIDR